MGRVSECFGVRENLGLHHGGVKKEKVKAESCGPELPLERRWEIITPAPWKGLDAAAQPAQGEHPAARRWSPMALFAERSRTPCSRADPGSWAGSVRGATRSSVSPRQQVVTGF